MFMEIEMSWKARPSPQPLRHVAVGFNAIPKKMYVQTRALPGARSLAVACGCGTDREL